MPKKEKRPQRRTTIKDLPGKEKELTKDEQKNVKGGATGGAIWIKSSAAHPSDSSSN